MNKQIDISNVILQTERLVLRPFELNDLDDLFEYASVDGVGQMAGWLPHKDKEKSLNILKMFIEEKKTFALVKDHKVIGSLGIESYSEDILPEYENECGKELGFVLSKNYWGQGLMCEAVNRVIKYLFEEEKLDFIICGHFIDNHQSQRVQEKCGFKEIKTYKYVTRYDVIKESVISIIKRNDYE